MFYPFEDETTRVAMTYNGLTLNDPNADPNDQFEINILDFDPAWEAVTEPKTLTHGLEVYKPRRVQTIIRALGIVRGPTFGALLDKVASLNAAFDPVNAYRNDFATTRNRGFRPFASTIPTADSTNYPSGLIAAHINVRSMRQPVRRTSQYDGLAARFELTLLAADPRLYYDTGQSANRTDAGAVSLNNEAAFFPSWPTTTIDLSGAGSQVVAFTLASADQTVAFSLDLTGLDGSDTVIVDHEHRQIFLNGSVDMSLYVSGDYWEIPPSETSSLTISNTSGTLAGTVTVAWERAIG